MKGKKKIMLKRKAVIIIVSVLVLILVVVLGVFGYRKIHGVESKLNIKLKGSERVSLEVGKKYKEKGITASYEKNKISKYKTSGKVNNKKLGTYKITYTVKYKKVSKSITRKVKVVDKEAPVITMSGDNMNITVGSEYVEPGVSATDNYDGDITDKIETTNNIDKDKIGEYEVVYKVKDSSGNVATITRKVNVVAKTVASSSVTNSGGQKIAVLNYHFFYDPDIGESCGDGNCEKVSDFKAQLNYLKENNYKTLTMKEFRDWMYGNLQIPDKSVLITVDDGAMGTGAHNGNKLIPILEEYKIHATLFLITGWWDINNYKSSYLDIESHTHDMHNEGWCQGVTRGARMLCQSNEQVLNDLKTSISITGSKLAFCFPFYAYNDNAINLVKEAGFELAFIGGGYKVSRSTDKYHIPRYQIKQSTSLETFISYVS